MKQVLSKVTSKGQVTIPVEVRHVLGISPNDKIAFVIENNQVQLRRTGSVTDQTAGIFKGSGPVRSVEELRELAEQAIAEDVMERMGG